MTAGDDGRTAVDQCWDYLVDLPGCRWGIVSNLISFRLYERDSTKRVYEHFTLEAADHVATASVPEAAARTITISSFSKSWAVSGWRLGYAYGPGELVGKLSARGNIYYVCTPTPLQHALARVLLRDPDYYRRLRADFARKREIITGVLELTGFRVYPSRSSFYAWARIPDRFQDATELNDFLIRDSLVETNDAYTMSTTLRLIVSNGLPSVPTLDSVSVACQ